MSDKPETFTPPVHYKRSDGVLCCVHTIPVGPDSCPDCRDLAEADAYDADRLDEERAKAAREASRG